MPKAAKASECKTFQDIPNIGPAMAADFRLMGFKHPSELAGRDPYELYETLCKLTKARHDPCVIDAFIAAVRFMEGSKPTPWWHYTEERKQRLANSARAKSGRSRGSGRRAAPASLRKSRGSLSK